MNKLKVANFKAFSNEIILEPEGKSMLVCGENGSGKTSLFEAIQIAYCRDRMMDRLFTPATPMEEVKQLKDDFLTKYNNKKTPLTPFVIQINDVNYDAFDVQNTEVYFIQNKLDVYQDTINIKDILNDLNLAAGCIDDIIGGWKSMVLNEINESLKKYFYEDIQISLLEDDTYRVKIVDTKRGLAEYENVSKYFNEAKLHLIIMLIMLSFAQVGFMKNEHKEKILVIDDIVSSMDVPNRELTIRYLLNCFKDVQLFVFTHNVSFFNLFAFMIEDKAKWKFENLYEIGDSHCIYEFTDNESSLLRARLKDTDNPVDVGNSIRKRFEVLIVEIARLRYLKADFANLNTILDSLLNGESIYVKKDGNNIRYADALVREIEGLLLNAPQNEKIHKIQKIIDKYKENDKEFALLIPVLRDLKLYQKVVLHQLSHASQPYPTFSIKEESIILDLLEKLEDYVSQGKKKHNSGDITSM